MTFTSNTASTPSDHARGSESEAKVADTAGTGGGAMRIKAVRVRNFRSIRDETLECDRLTALVGRNGAGKSTLLVALELFYAIAPKVTLDDFYNRDPSESIEVAVTFVDLQDGAKKRFSSYLQDGTLTVERLIRWIDEKSVATLHGASLQVRDFVAIREEPTATARKQLYNELRAQAAYSTLSPWRSKEQAEEELTGWEKAHPEQRERRRDSGQFFGFEPVAKGYLGDFTRLLSIPAVRDASEASADKRGAALTDLMDLVVRSVIEQRDSVRKLRHDTQTQYDAILSPESLPELPGLEAQLTTTLRSYVPDAEIKLEWLPREEVSLPLPRAEVKLVEDGFEASVNRTGHGLQRAFLMTLLQHLSRAQCITQEGGYAPDLPDLMLIIEEPELYQHPTRQRHLSLILSQLACGTVPGVAKRTQVLYTTHSPFFVGIDRIDQIRLLRKVAGEPSKPSNTKITQTTMACAAEAVWRANGSVGQVYTAESLRPRLRTVMTPQINEGFFAEGVVLVEGEGDRAAILGGTTLRGTDLDSLGIAVLGCGGKTSIDRPAIIFEHLGIPTYLVWDSDKGKDKARCQDNHRLLRIVGAPIEDWPFGVHDGYASFAVDLETTLKAELGAAYDESLGQAQTEFDMHNRDQATKNPAVIARTLEIAASAGKRSPTLETIVDGLLFRLSPRQHGPSAGAGEPSE